LKFQREAGDYGGAEEEEAYANPGRLVCVEQVDEDEDAGHD